MNDDVIGTIFIASIIAYVVGGVATASSVLPLVRSKFEDRGMPKNAITACCALLMIVAPLTMLMTGLFWVCWWLFYLGVAVRHLLPKRKPKAHKADLPAARVTSKW